MVRSLFGPLSFQPFPREPSAAERRGFEPLVPSRAHLISNQAPSASRSSLRPRSWAIPPPRVKDCPRPSGIEASHVDGARNLELLGRLPGGSSRLSGRDELPVGVGARLAVVGE